MKKIAFFGGSFDPVHKGHVAIAHALLDQFALDRFVFIPAFHAPHKLRNKPTSAYDRFAMLCLATRDDAKIVVSKMELELPERPFSVETLTRLKSELPDDIIYFVMGADSWRDITAWREWEKVLSLTNHIVVTRPGIEVTSDNVPNDIRERIVDLRHPSGNVGGSNQTTADSSQIYFTDAVNIEVSATDLRRRIRENDQSWRAEVPAEVANYIEKYQIYT
jgi:nicotinate-nucleotide adenylyltransferase